MPSARSAVVVIRRGFKDSAADDILRNCESPECFINIHAQPSTLLSKIIISNSIHLSIAIAFFPPRGRKMPNVDTKVLGVREFALSLSLFRKKTHVVFASCALGVGSALRRK